MAVVAFAGFVFHVAPRATGWSLLHVHKEDGSVFLQDFLARGWQSTFDPYSGYLHVLARSVVGLAASVTHGHPEWFPIVVGVLVALVHVGAFWLSYAVLVGHAARPRTALLASSPFLFLPAGQWEVLGNVTNLRWLLVPAAVFALLLESRRAGLLVLGTCVAVSAALSDPLMVLLFPLALVRLVTARRWARVPSVAFAVAGIVHLLALRTGDRPPVPYLVDHPIGAVAQWIVRGPVVAVFGITGTEGLLLVGGVVLGCAAVLLPAAALCLAGRDRAFRARSGVVVVVLIVHAFALIAATLLFADYSDIALDTWYAPAVPSRYAVPPGLLLLPAIVLCLDVLLVGSAPRPARWVGRLIVAAALVAVVLDLRGDPYNTQGPTWRTTMDSARTECSSRASGPSSVVVQVTPTGVPTQWEARVPCGWVTARD